MIAAVSKDRTDIDFAIAKFKANKGLWAAKTLLPTAPKMVAAGTGHLDFSDENLGIVVTAETKRSLLEKTSILRVHGPMRQPEIDVVLKGAAVTAGL